jgi:rhamnose transport system permease protein
VASFLGLSGAMLGYLVLHDWPLGWAFVVVILLGIAAGAFNGLLITRLGLPSLAVTIGTLTLYRGFAVVILGPNIISTFPERYTNIGINGVGGTFLSWSVVFFLILAVIFGVALHMTSFGRSLFVMGLNKDAAIYAGIRVKRVKLLLWSGNCAPSAKAVDFRLILMSQE